MKATVSKGLSGGGYEYSVETPSGTVHKKLWAYPKHRYEELVKNGKIYFLIVFGRSWQWTYCWYLGKPFMKKYNFVFDEDNSQIIYYDKSESKSIVEKKSFVYFRTNRSWKEQNGSFTGTEV